MLDFVTAVLACAVLAEIGFWAAAVLAERALLAEPDVPGQAGAPFTLIKPVKGLDDGLEANFESIASADPGRLIHTVIALESADDPAYPVAEAFRKRHPERAIDVVFSGPNPGRMGKTHNMMAGLARARHDHVVFSDADSETTPELARQTALAFAGGREAVFALPRHARGDGLGDLLLESAVNHAFGPASALAWRLGAFQGCSGAWMGYSKSAIARVGGLQSIERAIADDFALSTRVMATGAPAALLSAPVPLRETGRGALQACARLSKWAAIIRACVPRLYAASPLLNPGLLALALLALCETTHRHVALGRALAALTFAARAAGSFATDAATLGAGAPWRYVVFAFSDLAALVVWISGWRSTVAWRGVRYRLKAGGEAEVLA